MGHPQNCSPSRRTAATPAPEARFPVQVRPTFLRLPRRQPAASAA